MSLSDVAKRKLGTAMASATDAGEITSVIDTHTSQLAGGTTINPFLSGAGRFTVSLAIGSALPTNPQAILSLLPPAASATANQNYYHFTAFTTGGAVTIPTGTAAIVATMNIHEPNITATGTVTVAATVRIADAPTEGGSNYALWVDSGVSRFDGNLDLSDAAKSIVIIANTAAALTISNGTTSIISVDTRNTVAAVAAVTITGSPPTIASAGSALLWNQLKSAAVTVTLTGNTTTTSMLGISAYFDTPTITDSTACTLTTASTLHVAAVANAGGSLTITNRRMISTGVTDCFLTNAGVWTDTASVRIGKEEIADEEGAGIAAVLEDVRPRSWRYREDFHGDDKGRKRFGIVADELPDAFMVPGEAEKSGISAGVMSSFNLAATKYLFEENKALKARLARLEEKLNPA